MSNSICTIKLTGVRATAGRYNQIQFDIINNGQTTTPTFVTARGQPTDWLSVEPSIFQQALLIYYSTSGANAQQGTATLCFSCCCCPPPSISQTVQVDGISSLSSLPS